MSNNANNGKIEFRKNIIRLKQKELQKYLFFGE